MVKVKFKKYMTEKNLLYLLIGILIITTIIDMYSALSSPIFKIAESNPIYLFTGSVAPLLVMNILVVIWIAANLKRSISISKIFLFCMLTLYLSLGHGVGVWANITATNDYKENPEQFIEKIQEYDVKDKVNSYLWMVSIVMILPLVVSFIAFSIAIYFYEKRQPKRNRIIYDICKLTRKLMLK